MRSIVLKRTKQNGTWSVTYDCQKLGTLVEHGLMYEVKLEMVGIHEHNLTHDQAMKILHSYNWSTYIAVSRNPSIIKWEPKQPPKQDRWT